MLDDRSDRRAVNERTKSTQRIAQLQVDWQMCDGHGLCAELLPEVVRLDEWGFPIIERPVPQHLERLAVSAVSACPKLALKLRRR